jgi:hypothetical protein
VAHHSEAKRDGAQRACCTKARSAQQERGPLGTQVLLHEYPIRAARVLHIGGETNFFDSYFFNRSSAILLMVCMPVESASAASG